MLLKINVHDYGAIGDGNDHSVSEWLKGGDFDRGYKSLKEIRQDYPHVRSLDDSIDWAATQAAFNAMPDGGSIEFDAGKVYVFDKTAVVEDKSFDAYMHDATIKMAADSVFNAIRVRADDIDQISYVNWHGGTFDGNKDEIDWPGSDSPDTEFILRSDNDSSVLNSDARDFRFEGDVAEHNFAAWDEHQAFGNNGLLGIQGVKDVLVEKVTLIDPISDGVVLSNVDNGLIRDSVASGGADINFSETLELYGRGFQSSYFKYRENGEDDGGTLRIDNVHTTDGSIGIGYSTNPRVETPPASKLIVTNSTIHNAAQNGLHVEHAITVEVRDSSFTQDDDEFHTNVFIGNQTKYATLENVTVIGEDLTFQQASNLIDGRVIDSTVITLNPNTDQAIENATHVINTYVETAGAIAINADHVIDSTIARFGEVGIRGAESVSGTVIDNELGGGSGKALENFKGDSLNGMTISNVETGVGIRPGDLTVDGSLFENIESNAITFNNLGSIYVVDSVFRNYGFGEKSGSLDSAAIAGQKKFSSAENVEISESTVFDSNNGNPGFFETVHTGTVQYFDSGKSSAEVEAMVGQGGASSSAPAPVDPPNDAGETPVPPADDPADNDGAQDAGSGTPPEQDQPSDDTSSDQPQTPDEAPVTPDDTTTPGDAMQWHKHTLEFDGPQLGENPATFTDYRLDVKFVHESGYEVEVPGYFAADGSAADSGAEAGTVWRAHFNPPLTGEWTWTAAFKTGDGIAVSDADAPSAGYFDGDSGLISVTASDKTGADLRGKGLLQTDGDQYMSFAGTGETFLKSGIGSPENFLAYSGFDDTPDSHDYAPHIADFNAGDPTWAGGEGKGLIGAVNYLSDNGVNSAYMMLMNIGGDGRDVSPWADQSLYDIEKNPGSMDLDDRAQVFDVSKLDQWEILFEHMQEKGITLHLLLQETENDQLLNDGDLGFERQLFMREMVARFGHHNGLIWNLGEENTNTDQQLRDHSEYLKAVDPYDHAVALHTYPNDHDKYEAFEGSETLDVLSFQTGNDTEIPDLDRYLDGAEDAGRPVVAFLDEPGNAKVGLAAEGDDGWEGNHENMRAALWEFYSEGGSGVEWYFGYRTANGQGGDLAVEDFRLRESAYEWSLSAREFFEKLPLETMDDGDAYVSGATANGLANPGQIYAYHLPDGGNVNLDLSGADGEFAVAWYDPIKGGDLVSGSVQSVSGGSNVTVGSPPSALSSEATLLVWNTSSFDFVVGEPIAEQDPGDTPPTDVVDTSDPDQDGDAAVTLWLVNTDTNEILGSIESGQTLGQSVIGNENISVVADVPPGVGSVRMTLGDYSTVENVAPYVLFGDSNGDYNDPGFAPFDEAKDYSLTVELFSGAGATDKISETSFSFSVGDEPADSSGPGGDPVDETDPPSTEEPEVPDTTDPVEDNDTGPEAEPSGGYFGINGSGNNQYFKIQIEDPNGTGGSDPGGKWNYVTNADGAGNQADFQGSGYYVFGSSNSTNIDRQNGGDEVLEYTIYVPEDAVGTFTFNATASRDGNAKSDEQNDLWLNFKKADEPGNGDIVSYLSGNDDNEPEPELNGFVKVYGGPNDGTWGGAQKIDGAPRNFEATLEVAEAGLYTIQIDGRSEGFHLDYFEFYSGSNPAPDAPNSEYVVDVPPVPDTEPEDPADEAPGADQQPDDPPSEGDGQNPPPVTEEPDGEDTGSSDPETPPTTGEGSGQEGEGPDVEDPPVPEDLPAEEEPPAQEEPPVQEDPADDPGAPDEEEPTDDGVPPSNPPAAVTLWLVDTTTNQILQSVSEGQSLDATLIGDKSLSLIADVGDGVGSVRLSLGDWTKVENAEPYALFGDKKGDFFDAKFPMFDEPGAYSITIETFSEKNGVGKLGETQVSFDVAGPAAETIEAAWYSEPEITAEDLPFLPKAQVSEPEQSPEEPEQTLDLTELTDPQTSSLSLVDTSTDEVLADLGDHNIVHHGVVDGRDLSVMAEVDQNVVDAESAVMSMDGEETRTENVAPFALFGNRGSDYFGDMSLTEGDEAEFEVDFFSENKGAGDLVHETDATLVVSGDEMVGRSGEADTFTIDAEAMESVQVVGFEEQDVLVVKNYDGATDADAWGKDDDGNQYLDLGDGRMITMLPSPDDADPEEEEPTDSTWTDFL